MSQRLAKSSFLIAVEDKITGRIIHQQPFTLIVDMSRTDVFGITQLAIRTFLREYDLNKNDIRLKCY